MREEKKMDEIEREDKVVQSQEAWEAEQVGRIEKLFEFVKTGLVKHRLVKIEQEAATRVIDNAREEGGKFKATFARDVHVTFVVDLGDNVTIEAATAEELTKKITDLGL